MTKNELQKTIQKNNIYSSRDAGLGYIFAIIIPYALSFLMMIICIMLLKSGVEESSITNNLAYKIISMMLMPIGFGITFFAYNKIKKTSIKAAEVKFKIGWKNALICIFFALASLFLLQYLIGGVNKILELVGFQSQDPPLEATSIGNYFIMLATMALLPAVFEELIFRGIVLHGLRSSFSEWGAILFSALLFALMHGSIEQLVYPFILGTILGWLALRTGSIFSSMIVHFLNNALVITFDFISFKTGFNMSLDFGNWWSWIVAIVLAAVMIVIILLFEKYYKFDKASSKGEEAAPEKKQVKERPPIVIWIALALGAVIFLAGTIAGFMPK